MSGDDIYRGLRSLAEDAFPRRCATCGREYRTIDDFLRETRAPQGPRGGIKPARDDDNHAVLEIFRNCVCGSTLMDVFGDRRDFSERGQDQRSKFELTLDLLVAQGGSREAARAELLKALRGESSELISRLLGPSGA